MLVVDEAYVEFAAGAGYETGFDLVNAGRNVVAATSRSNGFQMWVRWRSTRRMSMSGLRRKLRPSLVANSNPPAPPPTTTICVTRFDMRPP